MDTRKRKGSGRSVSRAVARISTETDAARGRERQTEWMVMTNAQIISGSGISAMKPARWVFWAAHAVPLCVLPSGLWRVAMSVGIPVGFCDAVLRSDYDLPGWGALYTVGLAIVLEGLALLTLGLVHPWGQFVPQWIPLLGGKRVRPLAAVMPAAVGALLITLITFSQLMLWGRVDNSGLPLMGLSYAPMLAWGPLLGVVTVSYYLRTRPSR